MVHVIVFTEFLVHSGQNPPEYCPFKVQECGSCTETGREHFRLCRRIARAGYARRRAPYARGLGYPGTRACGAL